MNRLLARFLAEATDLTFRFEAELLRLDIEPGCRDVLDELFRIAHTIKGASAIVGLAELTALTHAAEDLLDLSRAGQLRLTPTYVDDLLSMCDVVRRWLAHVETAGALPDTAGEDAADLLGRLRGAAAAVPATQPVEARAPAVVSRPPQWLRELGDVWLRELLVWLKLTGATVRFVRYLPDEQCFRHGDDPLFLVRQVPALERLVALAPPSGVDLDPYTCRTGFVFATRAATVELRYLFEYVEDDVEIVDVGAGGLTLLLTADEHEPDVEAPAGEEPGADDPGAAGIPAAGVPAAGVPAAGVPTAAAPAAAGPSDAAPAAAAPPVEEPATGAPVGGPGRTGTTAVRLTEIRTLKVDYHAVDHLMEMSNELTVMGNALAFLADSAQQSPDARTLGRRLKDHHAVQHRVVREFQAALMRLRLVPLSVVLAPLPRLVRDLGRRLGKQVDLVLSGEEAAADKDILETLGDPLVHLVRNAVDHGVEPAAERVSAGKPVRGKVSVTAASDGYVLIIEVADDGRGIDPERLRRDAVARGVLTEDQADRLGDSETINLAFRPGISTASEVSDVSGRGVGMDAVRASIARMGGDVTLTSLRGRGTTVRLRLPVSMAVTRLMVVTVADQRFGVPMDAVAEITRVAPADVTRLPDGDAVVLRGDVLPLIDLSAALGLPTHAGPDGPLEVLVVRSDRAASGRVALRVERLHRDVEVVVRPVDGVLAGHHIVSGTALLGDGLVLLVLNLRAVLTDLATKDR